MTDEHEEIETPIGPVKLPNLSAFQAIYCRACGEEIGGHCPEHAPKGFQTDFDSACCPYCGSEGGTLEKP